MMEAWLSWSLMTRSSSPSSVPGTRLVGVPAADEARATPAVPTSRAHALSSARWIVKVPQMKRTDAVPAP